MTSQNKTTGAGPLRRNEGIRSVVPEWDERDGAIGGDMCAFVLSSLFDTTLLGVRDERGEVQFPVWHMHLKHCSKGVYLPARQQGNTHRVQLYGRTSFIILIRFGVVGS
jgi:hypothetical protein